MSSEVSASFSASPRHKIMKTFQKKKKKKLKIYPVQKSLSPCTDVLMLLYKPPGSHQIPDSCSNLIIALQDNGHLCTALTSTLFPLHFSAPCTLPIISRLSVCQGPSMCCIQTAGPHLDQWNICVVFSFHFLSLRFS